MANHTHISFPTFDKDNIIMFFTLVERFFIANEIVDSNVRFDVFVSKLNYDVLQQIQNLIINKPNRRPYEILKEEIIQLFCKSPQNGLCDLVNLKFNHSCKDLLERMWKISDGLNISNELLKSFLFNKLPTPLKGYAKLLKSNLLLKDYCKKLDEIYEEIKIGDDANDNAVNNTKFDYLVHEMKTIKSQLRNSTPFTHNTQIPANNNFQQQNNTRNFQNYAHYGNFPSENKGVVCFYHARFGDRAFKCIPPCYYPNKKNM